MPRLWTDTVESHRREVREAVLNAVGQLVASGGLLAVSMSHLAEVAGIGRATLYKYYPDVEAVLVAWHARAVAAHLAQLADLAAAPGAPADRLRAVLDTYGEICRQRARHGGDALAAALHTRTEHHRTDSEQPERQLHDVLAGLLVEAATAGMVRNDVPADLLAAFCVSALNAAGAVESEATVETVVDLVWAGLQTVQTPVD